MASEQRTTSPRRFKFTKTTIVALPVPQDGKPATWWDGSTVGLGVRISPAGRRTYFLQARTRAGRAVKITLGTADRITPDQAREAGKKHLAALALGRDPAAERQTERQAEHARRAAATLRDLWEDFEVDHIAAKLRPKSQAAYRSWYRCHIASALGHHKLGDLNRGRIEAVLKAIAAASGKSTANRVGAVISAMLTFGEGALDAKGQRKFPDAVNCARGITAHPEPGRERELSDDELRRLIAYLERSTALEARLIELALATGARRGELLGMQWSEINGAWWTIPSSRSKSRKKLRKPMSAAALAVLAKLDRRGEGPFDRLTESRLSVWWRRVRVELDLADVHVHDLRHAAASLALNAGIPLAAVGALLGHGINSAAMSARYAHLADAQLARASDAVAERLALLREATPAGSA